MSNTTDEWARSATKTPLIGVGVADTGTPSIRGWWLGEPAGPGRPAGSVVWLAGRELRAGHGLGEVRLRRLGREPDDRAVDVDADRAVGGRLAGRRVDAGEQVG